MAVLRVSYQDPDGRGHYHSFFVNFMDSIEYVLEKKSYDSINDKLESEYGARMLKQQSGIMYVEFPTEEDITAFMVRWA